jgi:hypothetical protein
MVIKKQRIGTDVANARIMLELLQRNHEESKNASIYYVNKTNERRKKIRNEQSWKNI